MIEELEKQISKACEPYMGMPLALSGGIDSSVLACLMKPKFVINVEIPGGEIYNESNYARLVAQKLGLTIHVVKLEHSKFIESVREAVGIIGEPSKHFNVYPFYEMFKVLHDIFKEKDLVLADGPDETMYGYARDLIFYYIMNLYDYEAFKPYHPLIRKIVNPVWMYSRLANLSSEAVRSKLPIDERFVNRVNIEFKRPEMDMMANKISQHFGIQIHKPYETKELDEFMYNLPLKWKVHKRYGKYALRKIAEKYLPKEIVWRKVKRGGPVYPVNKLMGWMKTDGEFDKGNWLEWQRKILEE